MDILGIIGGFYEVLYISSSVFIKVIVEYFFKKSIKGGKVAKSKEKDWFSYPSRLKDGNKNKSNKVQHGEINIDLEESKHQFGLQRSQIYLEDNGEEEDNLDISKVKKQIADSKYFLESLD